MFIKNVKWRLDRKLRIIGNMFIQTFSLDLM